MSVIERTSAADPSPPHHSHSLPGNRSRAGKLRHLSLPDAEHDCDFAGNEKFWQRARKSLIARPRPNHSIRGH